jgi:hypothetical protein
MNSSQSEGATASRNRFRAGLCAGVLAFAWQGAAWGEVLDFEQFSPGDIVSQVILGGVLNGDDGKVIVDGKPYYNGTSNSAMVFNAACNQPRLPKCTGGEKDLSRPAQGNILIVSRDGDASDPDDIDVTKKVNEGPAIFSFNFTGVGAITLQSMKVMDVEATNASVMLTRSIGGNLTVPITPTGNAGIGTVVFGNVQNVTHMTVNLGGEGAIDDITFNPERVVLAQNCIHPGNGGCELYTVVDLSDNVMVSPTDTVTESAPDIFIDPRVNPATGRCDGGGAMPRGPLMLYGGSTGKPVLVIDENLCGSPRFAVLTLDKEFAVLSGTVEHVVDNTGLVPGNGLICEDPIVPGSLDNLLYPDTVGDPQLSAVFGWQPKNRLAVAEQQLIELTNGCDNPTRSKTVDLSYITAGLHYDFGCTYEDDPDCVFNGFVGVLSEKFQYLRMAVEAARPALSNADWVLMSTRARQIEELFFGSDFNQVRLKLDDFLAYAGDAIWLPTPQNHEGQVISRLENAEHIFRTRVWAFQQP